jgi:FkbM family methyltransferase
MAILITNIINGIWRKLMRKKSKSHFPAVSWWMNKRLKHEEDQSKKNIRIGNLKITYIRPYEVLHTYRELFEDEIYNFTSATTSPRIIDCGANIGLSVLYFKKLYPHANIIAFEPDEKNFELLQQNVKQNNLTNVECRKEAIWTTDALLTFASEGTQASQITTDNSSKNRASVKAVRLADILKKTSVDFLKIDIEGAEVDVIKDCEQYLHNVTQVFVEYHGKTNETEKLLSLLEALQKHYRIYIKLAADGLLHPFVKKSTGNIFDVQLNIFCYK